MHPRFSIITPTHNMKYIAELYASIQRQTFIDWEWVIVVNNGAQVNIQDERVRVIELPFPSTRVGQIKKFAFSHGKGEILVEADHDDLLTPDCLEELDKAFKDESIGFAYSDNAKLGNFVPYDKKYGWEFYSYNHEGKDLIVMKSFEPSAASLAFIWYAPDHVRAWRKSVYNAIGGHTDMDILDDQDLMARTYIASKIFYIPKCLYIYRIDGENTWLKRNESIQMGTVQLYRQYSYALAERWADLNGLEKLDMGGAFGKPAGYKSVDLHDADVICDFTKGLPFADGSVGVIRAHDFIEHIADKQFLMKEFHRVLADGGWLLIAVPSTDGRGAWQDPTHVSYWNENAFWYWTRGALAKYIRNDTIHYQEYRLETIFPSDAHKEQNISYVMASLSAIKSDKRRPHIKNF